MHTQRTAAAPDPMPSQDFTPEISFEAQGFQVCLAKNDADLHAAQALRYEVFVAELGGTGAGVDHHRRIEADPFDTFSDHLLVREARTGDVVGVYRILPQARAEAGHGFYSASEFDLSALIASGQRLLELGRSCLRADHRAGPAMFHLWSGLARYVQASGADILFGVASLKGTDVAAHAPGLSLLHHRYLAPARLRPQARSAQPMDLIPETDLDRRAAMVALPSLVKSYLRLGGRVGQGAFIDHDFKCIDVCMVMDTHALEGRSAQRLLKAGP